MRSLSEQSNKTLFLTGFFATYHFLQFAVLRMANHAGDGFLSTERLEQVYFILQIFVIAGFWTYAVLDRRLRDGRRGRRAARIALALLLAGGIAMFYADSGSAAYLAVTFASSFCIGFVGGPVYRRMSRETAAGAPTARCMGFGSSIAVALQYVFQLWRGPSPFLPVLIAAACVLLWASLREGDASGPLSQCASDPAPNDAGRPSVPPRRIAFSCLIAAAFVLLGSFYNGYIHHLQIQSGYTDYNAYSWPRLVMIPCYLLFAALGDRRNGRFVPILALCLSLVAVLNSVLTASRSTYWLNMCLFYCTVAAFVAYYNLTFWRFAEGTKRPAFWASQGRVIDSVTVLATALIRFSALPSSVVQTVNIAIIAAVIVLMAVSGDFNLAEPSEPRSERAPETAPAPPALLPDDAFQRMQDRYGLTQRETDVLRELVLTEDKQAAIGNRLSITVKTLQEYVTRLYRKTGAVTRSGLTDLYHETLNDR